MIQNERNCHDPTFLASLAESEREERKEKWNKGRKKRKKDKQRQKKMCACMCTYMYLYLNICAYYVKSISNYKHKSNCEQTNQHNTDPKDWGKKVSTLVPHFC